MALTPPKRRTRRWIAWVVAFVALVAAGLTWRASWIAHRLLRSWAETTIRESSGDVYRLDVGRIRINFALRRVSVDSILVSTNESINAQRTERLASLGIALHSCTISGVQIAALVRSQGLFANSFGCKLVAARFVVPPGAPDTAAESDVRGAMLALQQRITLPSFAPRVRIGRIELPEVALDMRVQHAKGSDSRVHLQHFRWVMLGLDVHPADPASAARPMFSNSIELVADSLVVHPDSNTVLRVTTLFASLTDSTMNAHGFSIRPTLGPEAYARQRPYRRKYTALRVEHIALGGVDVGALLLGQGLRARSLTADSLMLDVTNDHLLPAKSGPKASLRTPQQWIADLNRPIRVDSVMVRRSRITYRLRNSGREDFGVITFARINALALGANTTLAGASVRAPMRLAVTTYFQDAGLLSAYFAVPLRAPRFDMEYRGTLGPMSADRLSQFIEATTTVRIAHGEVAEIDFRGTITDGLTLGTVTPRYEGFTLAVNQVNASGLLGRNGFFGNVARKLTSFAANWRMVYAMNPERARTKARVGKINRLFATEEALPDYLWYGIRDGLSQVIRR